VIVPVYNDAERVCLCLRALEQQTYRSDRYEVVVVDNASIEPVAPLLGRYPHAVPEFEAQPGSYAARNRAFRVARGDIFAFTDSDCIPSPSWIEQGVAGLEAQRADLIAGRIDVFPVSKDRPNSVESFDILFAFRQEQNLELGFAPTANLFARRSVADHIGPFDAGLKSGGDREWTARAVAAGHRLAYHNDAVVLHPARRSLREMSQRLARIAGGHYDRSRDNHPDLWRERISVARRLLAPAKLAVRMVVGPLPAGFTRSSTERAKVTLVGVWAHWSYALEWLRLELGARSRR
jgi:glycosyltransferase involved in cell wall biosynthesis